jgi:DNA-binding MarR family transcriptional regulator
VNAAATLGPTARRVLAMSIEGNKRRKVLLAVALYADSGRADPSIGELVQRTKLPRSAVVSIVDMLDRDGLLEVRRGACALGQRNAYRFPDAEART